MTMVPAENLSKQQHLHHHHHHHHQYLVYSNNNNNKGVVYPGGCGDDNYSEYFGGLMSRIEIQGHDYYCTSTQTTDQSNCFLGSDLGLVGPPMAEDESRTNSLNESSSKDERDEGWLQLGIGTGHMESNNKNNLQTATATTPTTTMDQRRSSGGLVELDLLPGAGGGGLPSSRQLAIRSSSIAPMFHVPEIVPHPHPPPRPFSNFTTTSLYFQQHHHHHHHMASSSSNFPSPHHQQEVNWAFRPILSHNIGTASTSSSSVSSSSSSMPPLGAGGSSSYFARQFQLQQSGLMDVSAAGPSIDFRVVSPPRRPHSGIWFMLQASQNQAKQPFLPQIPKNYLRIKDGGMTVRLLIKYLVNKLRLDSESEIEITCRGQQLLPFLTLQHVRDHIWSRRDAVCLLPDSPTSTSDHVMVLQYARTSA
ncbi:protein LAX PANICLE 2 isoform X2 [Ziziphus jujuba]|uniref:Protein LAX PANICLE 2 isoform X2 n=1 Tax=Ziziphus jujuba TaxID=326968 RepID=A0A6P4AFW7_ZIZJJ|nr:protein LAX PANICLE 2 isoform X2 [Ziziphus jujuba]